jgi:hypothetical protein
MDDLYEDDLVMYEESKEIKETIWKIWDIINDKEIILKLLLNTSLINYIKNIQPNNPLESKDEKFKNQENSINDSNKNKPEENGKFIFYIIYFNIYIYRF